MYTVNPLVAGQPEQALGDDVALDFGGAAGDGAAERSDVALEPTGPVEVEVKGRVRAGDGGVDQRLGSGGGQRVFGRRLRSFGAEQLQHRERACVLVAARGTRKR